MRQPDFTAKADSIFRAKISGGPHKLVGDIRYKHPVLRFDGTFTHETEQEVMLAALFVESGLDKARRALVLTAPDDDDGRYSASERNPDDVSYYNIQTGLFVVSGVKIATSSDKPVEQFDMAFSLANDGASSYAGQYPINNLAITLF